MKIGALAAQSGVDVETIRYYDKLGLLGATQRLGNGYRQYQGAQLERLAFIRHCRALDMPLKDVQNLLLALDHGADHPDRPLAGASTDIEGHVDDLLDEHLARVRSQLAALTALEQRLTQLRARCDAHDQPTCGILTELVHAATGEGCACHPPGDAASDVSTSVRIQP